MSSACVQGLGKTITALSLVLSTKGIRPKPPPGKEAVTLSDARGRQASFYMVEADTRREAHGSANGASRRSDRSMQPVDRFVPEADESTPKPVKPMPGHVLRSNSAGAVRQPPTAGTATATPGSPAGSMLPAGAQAIACCAPPRSCQGSLSCEDGDGPLRKRPRLEDGCSEATAEQRYAAKCAKTVWVQCEVCEKWRSLEQVCSVLVLHFSLPAYACMKPLSLSAILNL